MYSKEEYNIIPMKISMIFEQLLLTHIFFREGKANTKANIHHTTTLQYLRFSFHCYNFNIL